MWPSVARRRATRIARDWYEVVFHPRLFFRSVNERDRGQRAALGFFAVVVLVARLPEFVVAGDPARIVAVAAILLLLSPVVLHFLTGLQYLLLWLVTDEDAGVDRTLRALAYGSAPGVLAAAPYLGAASFVGIYAVAVGLQEGHGLGPLRATVGASLPGLLLFGLVFDGFDAAIEVWRLAVGA